MDRAAGRVSTSRGLPKEGFGNLGFQTAFCLLCRRGQSRSPAGETSPPPSCPQAKHPPARRRQLRDGGPMRHRPLRRFRKPVPPGTCCAPLRRFRKPVPLGAHCAPLRSFGRPGPAGAYYAPLRRFCGPGPAGGRPFCEQVFLTTRETKNIDLAQTRRSKAAKPGRSPANSGCGPERRSSEVSEFSRLRGNEGYGACSDDAVFPPAPQIAAQRTAGAIWKGGAAE